MAGGRALGAGAPWRSRPRRRSLRDRTTRVGEGRRVGLFLEELLVLLVLDEYVISETYSRSR